MPVGRLAIALTLVLIPSLAQAQPGTESRTVQDGVFDHSQAQRGRAHYEATCQRCHGADLSGGGARPLVGDEFLRNWLGLPLDGLFEQLNSMPPSAAGSLGGDAYLEILTYILEQNGFPAGEAPLRVAALTDVRIEGADGPQEVPDNTLVQVVGCLSQHDDEWLVTGASEPVRTRNPNASTGEELTAAEAATPTDGSYRLLYVFPSPEAFVGQRVEAKGFLIRGDQDALNVTAVAGLGPACRP